MITQTIFDSIPEIYREIFPDLFQEHVPVETLATCLDCAMCVKPNEPAMPGVEYFKPDAKCCTFFPKLPNYLVGGLLSDNSPEMAEGRRRVQEKIEARIGINPYGVFPPKKYSLIHKYGNEQAFGRNQSLLCPYFVKDNGTCSVWKFRESTCTTYYCKSVTGHDGQKFWSVLRAYLLHAQESLVWYALYKLNWDVESISNHLNTYNSDSLGIPDLDDTPLPDEAYSKLWGEWAGREMEFFKRTHEIIRSVSQEEFVSFAGMNQRVFLKWLTKRRDEMISPKMPSILIRNPQLRVMPIGDEKYMVKTDTGFFMIENSLYQVLDLFDGKRTTAEVAKIVEEEWDDTLREDLLIPMYQNMMLLPA